MTRTLYLGGVKGVGKTTVMDKALTCYDHFVKIAKCSEVMAHIAGMTSVECLDSMNPDFRESVRKQAHEYFFDQCCDMIIDGHYMIPYEDGTYEKPFQHDYAERIAAFVVIEADVDSIYRRRCNDFHLKRRKLCVETIKNELEMELLLAKELSEIYDKPLFVIENDMLHDASTEFRGVLDIVFNGHEHLKNLASVA